MTTPAIGSRWRSKRNGRVAEVVGWCSGLKPLVRMKDDAGLLYVRVLRSGRPCGYEAVPEGKEGEG